MKIDHRRGSSASPGNRLISKSIKTKPTEKNKIRYANIQKIKLDSSKAESRMSQPKISKEKETLKFKKPFK